MYIAFEKNPLGEPESKVFFLGDEVAEAIVGTCKLQKQHPESTWVMGQVIDENNSQIHRILTDVIKLMEEAPKQEA
jgi:hypothetical protein